MWLIAGRLKGFTLQTPKSGTRPTTDRAKEGVFSHLESENMLQGVRVLDLFAGTGALGFEALSRGAISVVFIDSSAQAIALLRRAAVRLRHHPAYDPATMHLQIEKIPAERYVRQLARQRQDDQQFDLVFMDPPYALTDAEFDTLLAQLVQSEQLTRVCEIVAERSAESSAPTPPAGWEIEESRKYGETMMWYLVRAQS
jgi:16S rRNA (guanine966-N2)-methyltransferase